MTESDAKTKWCPMVRVRHNGDDKSNLVANRGQVANGENVLPYNSQCIGSDCMMWRGTIFPAPPDHGYCGLAGKL